MNPSDQENLMSRYLLGELSESEQTAIEDEYFADGEKFERMWAAENDLVDRYVRGRLSRADRQRFERHYLATPRHRERVAFARSLLKAADHSAQENDAPAAISESEPEDSWWVKLVAMLRGPQLALGVGLAMASLLLTLGVVWSFLERGRLREQLARLETERSAEQQRQQELERQRQELEKKLAEWQGQGIQWKTELERLRAEQRRIEAQKVTPQPSSQPALLSFLLTPGLLRGGGEPRQLAIPHSTAQVRLRMKLDGNDHRSYQVGLRAVDGGEVFRQQSLKARPGKAGAEVAVTIPAAKLTAGDYILTLSGVNAAGETEELNRYFFRVR
ncbi:MAG TPA: hypothetical protein VFD58_16655 [Blastocatellia bacterium]|nr:hypothetical protein [Blastocatellia bacterium]